MKIKKLKLFFMKATYKFDYYIGPYTTNGYKYSQYLRGLLKKLEDIKELEREITNQNRFGDIIEENQKTIDECNKHC